MKPTPSPLNVIEGFRVYRDPFERWLRRQLMEAAEAVGISSCAIYLFTGFSQHDGSKAIIDPRNEGGGPGAAEEGGGGGDMHASTANDRIDVLRIGT